MRELETFRETRAVNPAMHEKKKKGLRKYHRLIKQSKKKRKEKKTVE